MKEKDTKGGRERGREMGKSPPVLHCVNFC